MEAILIFLLLEDYHLSSYILYIITISTSVSMYNWWRQRQIVCMVWIQINFKAWLAYRFGIPDTFFFIIFAYICICVYRNISWCIHISFLLALFPRLKWSYIVARYPFQRPGFEFIYFLILHVAVHCLARHHRICRSKTNDIDIGSLYS